MRLFILLILTTIGLYSCNNNLTTIGQDLVFNGNNIELKTSRLTETGTIRIDSFATSSGLYGNAISEMYMGKYSDAYSGTTVAYPCFQIVPAYQPSIPTHYMLDSVTFHFTYAGKLWGDTLTNRKLQHYELWQLSETPELDLANGNYGYFYNNDSIPWGTKLASCEFLPRLQNLKRVYFKLDEKSELIQDMWNKMKYGDDIFRPSSGGPVSYYKFMQYFKGLAIKGVGQTDCIMAIRAQPDSLYMRFHYHQADNNNYFDLRLLTQTTALQYNGIYNYLPTPLEGLKTQEDEIKFSNSGYAIVQGLNAYMVKIILPQPEALDAYSVVIKAEIEIKPYIFANDPVSMPPTISVYETNDVNEIKGYLYNSLSSGSSDGTPVTGTYEPNREDPASSRYIFDITDYYQRISSAPQVGSNTNQMLLSIPNLTSSFNRMLIREIPTLRVYYANYN